MPTTTLIKVFAERYRHVPERVLNNKEGRYQELQELIYPVYHDDATTPEQEAKRLLEALKTGGLVRPRYLRHRAGARVAGGNVHRVFGHLRRVRLGDRASQPVRAARHGK